MLLSFYIHLVALNKHLLLKSTVSWLQSWHRSDPGPQGTTEATARPGLGQATEQDFRTGILGPSLKLWIEIIKGGKGTPGHGNSSCKGPEMREETRCRGSALAERGCHVGREEVGGGYDRWKG